MTTYKETPIKLSADFSTEILQARRERHNIVAVVKERKIQPRILHPAKLLLRIEGENSFPNKQKLKEFITTNLALKKCWQLP